MSNSKDSAPPPSEFAVRTWGDDGVTCFHPDHHGWAFHHREYPHEGPTPPVQFSFSNNTEESPT